MQGGIIMEFENINNVNDSNAQTADQSLDLNRRKRKGRPEKAPLDFSKLKDADHVEEYPLNSSFIISCAVCGGTKDVGFFKNGNICMKCVRTIKHRYS